METEKKTPKTRVRKPSAQKKNIYQKVLEVKKCVFTMRGKQALKSAKEKFDELGVLIVIEVVHREGFSHYQFSLINTDGADDILIITSPTQLEDSPTQDAINILISDLLAVKIDEIDSESPINQDVEDLKIECVEKTVLINELKKEIRELKEYYKALPKLEEPVKDEKPTKKSKKQPKPKAKPVEEEKPVDPGPENVEEAKFKPSFLKLKPLNSKIREENGLSPDPFVEMDLAWIDPLAEACAEPSDWGGVFVAVKSDFRYSNGSPVEKRAIEDYFYSLYNDYATQYNGKEPQ